MNPLHLFWIIPLSAGLGGFVVALFAGSGEEKDNCYYCPFRVKTTNDAKSTILRGGVAKKE